MRILILGGTAFLSSEIARQAVAAGYQVTCLARGSAAEPPDGATWVKADRSLGANSYAALAGNWDAVIECLPTCLAPGEVPRHAPVLAGPWLMEKFTSTVAAGTS